MTDTKEVYDKDGFDEYGYDKDGNPDEITKQFEDQSGLNREDVIELTETLKKTPY